MNSRVVLHLVGHLLMVVAAAIAVAWGVSWGMSDPWAAQRGLAGSAASCFLAGLAIWALTRGSVELGRREGIGIVTLGWIAATIAGALPFLFTGVTPSFVDALFESVSGFTTTGASVFPAVEELPKGILFWRALTHFLGGMGILILCVAIIPFLGVGGMQLFQAEMPGPSKDRLTPRIASTAKLLWGVYLLLNVAAAVLLRLGGMSWFDAVCHAFATLATGGFSTRNSSIAAFDSLYIELVLVVFMFLGGVNFALHYRALKGQPASYVRDPEFRFYAAALAIACLVCAASTTLQGHYRAGEALRHAVFACTSIMTTTGFSTEDFDLWPPLAKLVLLLVMFLGGCAGSTGGGIKHFRIFVALRKLALEVRQFLQPNAVYQVRLGRQLVEPDSVSRITAFVCGFLLVFAVASVLMSYYTRDLSTAVSAVAASLCNVGPGFSDAGPLRCYAGVAPAGKGLLIACMLLGRLELYAVLALVQPKLWRK